MTSDLARSLARISHRVSTERLGTGMFSVPNLAVQVSKPCSLPRLPRGRVFGTPIHFFSDGEKCGLDAASVFAFIKSADPQPKKMTRRPFPSASLFCEKSKFFPPRLTPPSASPDCSSRSCRRNSPRLPPRDTPRPASARRRSCSPPWSAPSALARRAKPPSSRASCTPLS